MTGRCAKVTTCFAPRLSRGRQRAANMSGIFKRCTTTSGITTRRARSCCSTSRSTDPSAYAESKLCDVLLAFAVARPWKDVKSNALEPGWVATKMGGPSAPDDLHQGCVTQAWLATSKDEFARSTCGYFYH